MDGYRFIFFFSFLSFMAFARPNEVSYKIEVELEPHDHLLKGFEQIVVTNHTGKSLNELYFHVYPNAFDRSKHSTYLEERAAFERSENVFLTSDGSSWLKVSSVSSHGSAYDHEISKELLTVTLPTPLSDGESRTLEIAFTTRIGEISERSGTWNDNYAVGQWFPKLVVYDDEGWALKHNRGYHYIGEFYGDFGSYDVSITTPANFKVGATGHLLSSEKKDDKILRHYQAENVHDFAWVADPHYEETLLTSGNTKIHVFTRNSEEKVIGEYARNAIAYAEKRIGPFPYEDFTVAETYYQGGMEYPQMIFVKSFPAWMGRWFDREILRELEVGIEHETTHQWFYGAVGNNEVVDAWLDEGFTTYFEEAFQRDTYGDKDNYIRFTDWAKLPQKALGDMIWRSFVPDIEEPIQTPSYEFKEPDHYYAQVYYGTALFFRQFESLIGTQKLDELFHEYFRRNKFKNAKPEDWYQLVKEKCGPDAEKWWRDWISKTPKSDYTVEDVEEESLSNGKTRSTFTVEQLGKHFVPVWVELTDQKGQKARKLAPISEATPARSLTIESDSPPKKIEVDPDHDAPDVDRFNNDGTFLPSLGIFPFTTKTLRDDAIVLAPFPFLMKPPGIGYETGVGVFLAHYVDWTGYALMGYDWRHDQVTLDATLDTWQPEFSWGWTLSATQNVLIDQKSFLFKKNLGPGVDNDPQNTVRIGPEYFGNLGDGKRTLGLGLEYAFSNIKNGRDLRYSFSVHNTFGQNIDGGSTIDRFLSHARIVLPTGFRSYLDLKGNFGTASGNLGKSSLFDLQADQEGGMRFDWYDVGLFKESNLQSLNVEWRLGVPYHPWIDSLAVIDGRSLDFHLFADVSNSPRNIYTIVQKIHTIVDFGFGTRVFFPTGSFGSLGINLEIVPYETATKGTSWKSPIVLLSVTGSVE